MRLLLCLPLTGWLCLIFPSPAAGQALLFRDLNRMLPAATDVTAAVALGDVDGDVDATAQLPMGAPLDLTRAMALGDVDGDGDLDAFLGNQGQNRLYLNDGTGAFSDATSQLPAIFDDTGSAALGDLDGDGDLDAFLGNWGQDRLLRNDGTGVFTDSTAQLPGILDNTLALALGDIDGDGDLDALIGNYGISRFLKNLTRHLAWRGVPRIGKPLSLDAFGPPSGAWVHGFSLATANLPMPPLGTLRLDPSSLGQAFAGPLDAEGRASATYPLPADAALLGIPVY